MDSYSKRVHDAVYDYLEYANSMSHPVAAKETLDALKTAADRLDTDPSQGELSPGERELLSASEGVYEQVSLDRGTEMSPGEREVLANQEGAS